MADDGPVDRLLWTMGKRASGRTIFLIASAIYGGFGLALPLVVGWPTFTLVLWNIAAVLIAGLVVLVWLAVQSQRRDRRHLVEWTTDLRLLDAAEFEWLVGEVFRREGWQVDETGRQDGPDGNVDLRIRKGQRRAIVQCKRWTAKQVGVDEIRAFAGTLHAERLPGTDGSFVTLSGFTPQAIAEAKRTGIALIDKQALYARVEAVRRPEPCPTCEKPMVLDRSARGWWFRCVTDGCAGKRDLGRDPARAVGLLTDS